MEKKNSYPKTKNIMDPVGYLTELIDSCSRDHASPGPNSQACERAANRDVGVTIDA